MDDKFERYSRQLLFAPIGRDGQERLANRRVLIVGMGALGTVLASHLVRSGVGAVRFVDRDYVEKSNLQRQMLFDESDVGHSFPKAIAAEKKLRAINSEVALEPVVADVTAENVEALLDGVDLVTDGTDNFATRFLLNDACFRKGIPFVYGGAVSSRGMSAMFVPGRTACLRCLLGDEGDGEGQTCDTIGVISPVVDMVASYQSAEALKYLAGAEHAFRNRLVTVDVWRNQHYEMKFPPPRADCPTCGLRVFPALQAGRRKAATLCGRNTVQIHERSVLDLTQWRKRLAPVSKVSVNPFLLRAELPEGERLVLFSDGRVLVQGTEDIVRARTLYARYIGG